MTVTVEKGSCIAVYDGTFPVVKKGNTIIDFDGDKKQVVSICLDLLDMAAELLAKYNDKEIVDCFDSVCSSFYTTKQALNNIKV